MCVTVHNNCKIIIPSAIKLLYVSYCTFDIIKKIL